MSNLDSEMYIDFCTKAEMRFSQLAEEQNKQNNQSKGNALNVTHDNFYG